MYSVREYRQLIQRGSSTCEMDAGACRGPARGEWCSAPAVATVIPPMSSWVPLKARVCEFHLQALVAQQEGTKFVRDWNPHVRYDHDAGDEDHG
jgi:hypothetical protein